MGRNMKERATEDELCARYIGSLLGHGEYDHREAVRELLFSPMTRLFTSGDYPHFPAEDPIICLQRDLYDDIVIQAREEDGLVVARPLPGALTTRNLKTRASPAAETFAGGLRSISRKREPARSGKKVSPGVR